jgi:biotin carboxyl carrier protein
MFEGWKSRLQTIIDLLESSEVNEIEVSFFGRKYRVSKGAVPEASLKPVQAENIVATPVVNASEVQPTEASVPAGIEVIAPMVGTFYRSSSPESPPFVNEGDHVTTGQAKKNDKMSRPWGRSPQFRQVLKPRSVALQMHSPQA